MNSLKRDGLSHLPDLSEADANSCEIKRVFFYSIFLLLLLSLPAGPALAEDHIKITPDVQVSTGFTDNFFYMDSNKESDIYVKLSAGIPVIIPLYIRNLDMSMGYRINTIYHMQDHQYPDPTTQDPQDLNLDKFYVYHQFNLNLGLDKTFEARDRRGRTLAFTLNDDVSTETRVLRHSESDPLNLIQYNTLSLDLRYEHPFSRISELALNISPSLKTYFDSGGNDHWDLDLGSRYRRKLRTGSPISMTAYFGMFMRTFDKEEEIPGNPDENPCNWEKLGVYSYYGFKGTVGVELAYQRLTIATAAGYEYDIYAAGNLDNNADLVFDLKAMYSLFRSSTVDLMGTQAVMNNAAGEIMLSRILRLRWTQSVGAKTQVIPEVAFSTYESEAWGTFDRLGASVNVSYQIVRNLSVNLQFRLDQHSTGSSGRCKYEDDEWQDLINDWQAIRFLLGLKYQFKPIKFGIPREI
ncbi:hypothetical protein ACFL4G_07645 [Thermodesulfobacteriota bacterium]